MVPWPGPSQLPELLACSTAPSGPGGILSQEFPVMWSVVNHNPRGNTRLSDHGRDNLIITRITSRKSGAAAKWRQPVIVILRTHVTRVPVSCQTVLDTCENICIPGVQVYRAVHSWHRDLDKARRQRWLRVSGDRGEVRMPPRVLGSWCTDGWPVRQWPGPAASLTATTGSPTSRQTCSV